MEKDKTVETQLRGKVAKLQAELRRHSEGKLWQDRLRVIKKGTNKRERIEIHKEKLQNQTQGQAGRTAGAMTEEERLRRQLRERSLEVATCDSGKGKKGRGREAGK